MKKLEPIGKYIQLSDVRNTDLSVTTLLGVAADKRYIPSVANVNGTDLSKYKVIHQGQFACNLMHVCRDGVLPVAMYKGEPAIISPAYPIFEVQDENNLLPEYLHMYLSRPEFDREAVFYAMKGIRGSLDWNDFIEMKIPIPDIDVQRKIVTEYQTIEKRIENNNRLIKVLEETAQNIYYHTFVENIDPENLPKGWKRGNIAEIAKIKSGKSIIEKRDSPSEVFQIPVAGATGIIGYTENANVNEKLLTTGRVGTLGVVNRYYEPIWAADNVIVIISKYYEFMYQILNGLDYNILTKLGVQSLITKGDLEKYEIIIPNKNEIIDYENKVAPIVEIERLFNKENKFLLKIKDLLLSKLS